MALMLAHRTGEHAANLGPDPVVVKPIMPGPDGLPGAKILRQVAPSAASLVQIQTGVDHLAHIRRQRLVNRKMWRNCLPLGIRQIAWIAPTVILVAFAMLRRPHGMLLLVHQQRTTGGSGRSLISRSVKQAQTQETVRGTDYPHRNGHVEVRLPDPRCERERKGGTQA